MRKSALLVFAVFARFSLDSARIKMPIARMAASQKINRAALDVFILLVLFYASVRWILFRIAGEALRFNIDMLRWRPQRTQEEFLNNRQDRITPGLKNGNRTVTNAMRPIFSDRGQLSQLLGHRLLHEHDGYRRACASASSELRTFKV